MKVKLLQCPVHHTTSMKLHEEHKHDYDIQIKKNSSLLFIAIQMFDVLKLR